MAADIPTIEPAEFTLGDTLKWTRDLSDYPATLWTLTYSFVNADAQFAITASADGTTHSVTVAAGTSAAYTAGTYKWQAYVTGGSSERYLVGEGTAKALPNFAVETSGYDGRSHVKTTLDAIQAVLQAKASFDQASMSLNGRSISRYSIAELLPWEDKYKALYAQEVKAERIAAGLGHSGKVRIRFKN